MLTNAFIRHVYRTARGILKGMRAAGYEYSIRDAVESAYDGVTEYWQG